MTPEQIAAWAREAGVFIPVDFDGPALGPLQRFADLAFAAGQPKWQPIETAPKVDKKRLLLWVVHANAKYAKDAVAEGWAGPCVGSWLDFNGGGWSWSGHMGEPTLWTPLLETPKKAGT